MNWLLSFFIDRTFGVSRASGWSNFRKTYIKKNPFCAVCGTRGTLLKPNEAHHILPVSFDIERKYELDYSNLITLCESKGCHLRFGHLYDFKSANLDIVNDAKVWREKIRTRP